MGVDNSGAFLIGFEKTKDIDYRLAFLSERECQEAIASDIDDYLYFNKGANAPDLYLEWRFGEPTGYESSGVVGFYIDSPSYGKKSFDLAHFASDVVKISNAWSKYVVDVPKVFVLNLQW